MTTFTRRLLSSFTAFALALSMVPMTQAPAYAGEEEVKPVPIATITLAEASSAVDTYSLNLMSSSVPLVGTAVKYVDRVNWSGGTYAKDFYDVLVEATNNDGTKDFLIKDKYTNGTVTSEGAFVYFDGEPGTPYIKVAELSNSVSQELVKDYISVAYGAFNRDHPEVFWFGAGIEIASTQNPSTSKTTYYVTLNKVKSTSYRTEDAITQGIKDRDGYVTKIMSAIGAKSGYAYANDAKSSYDVVQELNKWLVKNNSYCTTKVEVTLPNGTKGQDYPESSRTCLAALKGNSGAAGPVCEGYARAFKVVCDKLGINTVLVSGMALTGNGAQEPHMWNYVELDGSWYAEDATWNDTGDPSTAASTNADTTYEKYFLVGSDSTKGKATQKFITTHPATNQAMDGGLEFTNGPTLSKTDVDPDKLSGLKESDLSKCTIEFSELTYNGAAQTPKVTVKDGTKTLTENTDYTVAFATASTVNAGKYKATITAAGETYTGSKEVEYQIKPLPLTGTDFTITGISDAKYTGAAITPTPTVKHAKLGTLVANTDYSVMYYNNVKPGKATVAIVGKGNYGGTRSVPFQIKGSASSGKGSYQGPAVPSVKKPKKVASSKLAAKKNAITVRWTDAKPGTFNMYQVRYSTKKNMKNAKKVTIKNTYKTKVTIKKLKSKTKYYVQVRAIKKVGLYKYYGAWSTKKSIMVK